MSLQGLMLLALAAAPQTSAFFLMPCWPITTQRLDPIVNPGVIASHVHQIVGGNAFAPNMTYEDTQGDDVCTTCFVSKDHSNYWIPSLYFQNSNDSFESVDQVGSTSVYYFNEAARLGPNETMTPFPEGFRMLAGNPDKRTGGTDFADQAINYKCLNYSGSPTDYKGFPDVDCPDGIRAEVTFPSCWDGVNLDSSDHRSHVAYPTETYQAGECPSSHPVHLVTLLVEFIWDTHKYADRWPTAGENPFVWSTGDPTGFGLHADFLMGWDYDLLKSAVEQCDDEFGVLDNCAPFDGLLPAADQVYANPGTCTTVDYVDETIAGTLSSLPGCNPVDANTSLSTLCTGGATFNATWPGEDGSSSSSSAWLAWSVASGSSTSAASTAATSTAVATPLAVTTSVAAGSYGNQQSAYSTDTASRTTQSNAGAFYGASASSTQEEETSASATSTSTPTSTSTSTASSSWLTTLSTSAAAVTTTVSASGWGDSDAQTTLTVWDIDTVTVWVTETTESSSTSPTTSADSQQKREAEAETEAAADAQMIKREAARVLHSHHRHRGSHARRRGGGLS